MKKRWAKRDPIKNYFPLPNEIYHLGLSHGAIAVYGYLLSIENRSTYQCYPSYATIGHAVGICSAQPPPTLTGESAKQRRQRTVRSRGRKLPRPRRKSRG